MAQWININQNNRSMLAHRYSVLGEKTGPVLLPLVGLTAGREAGQQTTYGWVLKFILYRLRLLFCLLSQQCYYSITIAFQLAFVK